MHRRSRQLVSRRDIVDGGLIALAEMVGDGGELKILEEALSVDVHTV